MIIGVMAVVVIVVVLVTFCSWWYDQVKDSLTWGM